MLKAALVALVVVVTGVAAFGMWVPAVGDRYPAAEVRFMEDPSLGGVVTVDGLIVSATLERLDAAMAAHPGAVRVLRVTSGGGTTAAAARMAAAVNRARPTVRIEAGEVCSSACVHFLAAVEPALRAVDGQAWLRVHGGSARAPGETKEAGSEFMSGPVGEISPAWLAFLQRCPSEPLQRDAGLAMTWAEVQALGRPGRTVDCEAIAFRDKEWLFARYPASHRPSQPTVVRQQGGGGIQVIRPSR